jgi:hypothetical protein
MPTPPPVIRKALLTTTIEAEKPIGEIEITDITIGRSQRHLYTCIPVLLWELSLKGQLLSK